VNGEFGVDVPQPDELDVVIEDNRNFFGPYAMVEWKPLDGYASTPGCGLMSRMNRVATPIRIPQPRTI